MYCLLISGIVRLQILISFNMSLCRYFCYRRRTNLSFTRLLHFFRLCILSARPSPPSNNAAEKLLAAVCRCHSSVTYWKNFPPCLSFLVWKTPAHSCCFLANGLLKIATAAEAGTLYVCTFVRDCIIAWALTKSDVWCEKKGRGPGERTSRQADS